MVVMVMARSRVLPTRTGIRVRPSSVHTRAGGQWSASLAKLWPHLPESANEEGICVCEKVEISFVYFLYRGR